VKEYGEIRHIKAVLINILVRSTGKAKEDIERDIERDFYMGPAQAKEYGLLDEIVEPKKKVG
jgi:ATP-dependent Clp protease protease subunit